MISIKRIIPLSIFLAFITSSVYAQWIVNDPIHTIQSAINTGHLIQAEITRVSNLKNSIEQLRIRNEQLKSLTDLNAWKNKQANEIAQLTGYSNSLKSIYGSIGAQNGRLRERLNQAAVLKMSYDEYTKQESRLVSQRNEEALRRHDDDIKALNKTNADYEDVKLWESKIDTGLTEKGSSQMMNQQLNKLIAQNAETLKVMVANRIENREDKSVNEMVAAKNAQLRNQSILEDRENEKLEYVKKLKSQLPKPIGQK